MGFRRSCHEQPPCRRRGRRGPRQAVCRPRAQARPAPGRRHRARDHAGAGAGQRLACAGRHHRSAGARGHPGGGATRHRRAFSGGGRARHGPQHRGRRGCAAAGARVAGPARRHARGHPAHAGGRGCGDCRARCRLCPASWAPWASCRVRLGPVFRAGRARWRRRCAPPARPVPLLRGGGRRSRGPGRRGHRIRSRRGQGHEACASSGGRIRPRVWRGAAGRSIIRRVGEGNPRREARGNLARHAAQVASVSRPAASARRARRSTCR